MKKKKIIIVILISIFVSFIITKKISMFITKNVLHEVYVKLEKENDMALKNAYISKKDLPTKPDELIEIIKNKNDEIVELTFNIEKSEEIMNYITRNMANYLKKITDNGFVIYIPTGSIFNRPLISNLGPKIPVKIELTNIAMGNIRTEIREYGINNALVEIYVDIEVRIAPVLLSNSKISTKKYSLLLSSKIVTGKVPEYYNGRINKESMLFNLPVTENL